MPPIQLTRPLRLAACLGALGAMAGSAAAQDAPAYGAAPFVLDWSVGLRGGYTSDSQAGGRPEIILAPEVTLSRRGSIESTELATGGAVALEGDGTLRLDDFHARAKSSVQLDPATTLGGTAELSLTRAAPGDTSLPSNTAIAPQLASATISGDAARRFGHLEVALRGLGKRFVEGETVLAGGGVVDNTGQNYWLGQGGLRVGYQVTPLVTLFGDVSEGYQKYDIAAPGLGHFLDNRSGELRAGIGWGRDALVSAELTVGQGLIDYADPALVDRSALVYGAKIGFRPDPTLSLEAALDTGLSPSSNIAGDTDFTTTLTGAARYQVNPWLALRGSASWSRAETIGSGQVATGYGAGLGVDYQSTRHLSWNADYGFAHTDPASGAPSDSQRVSVGATLRR